MVIFHGPDEIARHRRGREPRQRIIDPRHYDGLWKPWDKAVREPVLEKVYPGRSLLAYQEIIEGSHS